MGSPAAAEGGGEYKKEIKNHTLHPQRNRFATKQCDTDIIPKTKRI